MSILYVRDKDGQFTQIPIFAGQDSGGNVAYDEEQELTEEQKAQARANIGAQPVGEYLTEVPEGYAKNEDIEKVNRKVDTLREVVSKFHSNIVETASGDVIAVSDASDMELSGLRIFGKTTQNGIPTPDAPVPLESVGDGGSVTVKIGVTETDENPQTLSVSQPTDVHVFLPGLKIPSDGNYTDVDGQQWICDEIDFANGKYVQRIGQDKLSSFSWTYSTSGVAFMTGTSKTNITAYRGLPPLLCDCYSVVETRSAQQWANHPDLSIGFRTDEFLIVKDLRYTTVSEFKAAVGETKFYYVLKEPIEHALTAEELAQYAALRTHYPNTTIFNDGGAEMEVKYVADTKKYIDKKFAELATALLNQ